MIIEFYNETKSVVANKIIIDFENELNKFIQVCPIEMLDKLEHPISKKELDRYNDKDNWSNMGF